MNITDIIMAKALAGGGGGGGGTQVLWINDNDGTLDKTYREIRDAAINHILPVVTYFDDNSGYYALQTVILVNIEETVPTVHTWGDGVAILYTAESIDDYPVLLD